MHVQWRPAPQPGWPPPGWPTPAEPDRPAEPTPRRSWPPLPAWPPGVLEPTRDEPATDLAERLFRRRIVLLTPAALDQPTATSTAAALMTLDAEGDDPVRLHLDCPDGDLGAALLLMDTVDLLGAPVHAVAVGRLSGPAVGVLAVADHRSAYPHAQLTLTEPRVELAGDATTLLAAAEQHDRQLRDWRDRLAAATGRPVDEVAADLRARRFLSAIEAVDYGLLDAVADRASAGTGRP